MRRKFLVGAIAIFFLEKADFSLVCQVDGIGSHPLERRRALQISLIY
jgi:hypothetical protein